MINDLLKKIKEAIYGEEVRNSIHDAIEQCYKDATGHPESVAATVKEIGEVSANLSKETTDRKAEVSTERKRIDNLIATGTAQTQEIGKKIIQDSSISSSGIVLKGLTNNNYYYKLFEESGSIDSEFCTITNQQGKYTAKLLKPGLYYMNFKVHVEMSGGFSEEVIAPLKLFKSNTLDWSTFDVLDAETVEISKTENTSINKKIHFLFRVAEPSYIRIYIDIDTSHTKTITFRIDGCDIIALDWKGKQSANLSELHDLRIGADGVVHNTAGEAVRKQIGNLTEDLDDLPFQLIKSKNKFNLESGDNQNKKSLSNVGAIIDDSNYSVSHKIKCKYGDTVYLSRKISDISDERQFVTVWNICAYDSSGKFLGISTKGSYAVPQNTDYVRFNYWTTLATTRKIMLSLNSDITYEEYFVPYRVIEKSAIDNPVKELFKDAGIIVERKIVMPMYGLYVMQGTSVPVFFDNIIMHGQAKNLNVFQTAKGNFVDNGIFQKSLETLEKGFYENYIIVNSSYNTLLKKNDDIVSNSRLTVVDINAGNGVTRKVLVIGDSITAANVWTDKLVDLFSDDVMNIEMLGTRGTSKAPNEGRGGWRAWNYAFEKDASNDGLSSSVTNPFLNPTSNNFDFSYYMTKQNYTSVDYVLLCLGTNDVSRNTHNTDDDILLAWKTIIDSIKSFDNNIKILIWLLPMPCGLTNEQPKKDMFLHMKELLINKYDNMASRQTNKIYLVDVGCSVSPTDDFNYKEELVSEYGDEKWKRPTDIIHPANKGYYAIAKNIHAGIKAIESGVITN